MFTGIIKNTGLIKEISKDDNFLTVNIDNLNFSEDIKEQAK